MTDSCVLCLASQVHIAIPIVFLLICGFLVFMPLYVKPMEVGMGILITFTGVPAYLVFVYWRNKPAWALRAIGECGACTTDLTSDLRQTAFI